MKWEMAGMSVYNKCLPVKRASWTDGQYLQFYDQVPVGAAVDGMTITRTAPGYKAGLYLVYDHSLQALKIILDNCDELRHITPYGRPNQTFCRR